jgi:hypothetical protein
VPPPLTGSPPVWTDDHLAAAGSLWTQRPAPAWSVLIPVVVVVVVVVVLMAALGVLLGIVRPRLGLLAGRENGHAVRVHGAGYGLTVDSASPAWFS